MFSLSVVHARHVFNSLLFDARSSLKVLRRRPDPTSRGVPSSLIVWGPMCSCSPSSSICTISLLYTRSGHVTVLEFLSIPDFRLVYFASFLCVYSTLNCVPCHPCKLYQRLLYHHDVPFFVDLLLYHSMYILVCLCHLFPGKGGVHSTPSSCSLVVGSRA